MKETQKRDSSGQPQNRYPAMYCPMYWRSDVELICIPEFLCGLHTQQLHIWSLVMSRTVAYLVRAFSSSL